MEDDHLIFPPISHNNKEASEFLLHPILNQHPDAVIDLLALHRGHDIF